MNRWIKPAGEKLLLTVALIAVAASATWSWWQHEKVWTTRDGAAAPLPPERAYVVRTWQPPPPSRVEWAEPAAQSRGDGWRYEIFTPPVIHRDAIAGTFSLSARRSVVESAAEEEIELLGVGFEPYRLQLQGYCGEPGDYLGIFSGGAPVQALLARAGDRLDDLGLSLKSVDVRRVMVEGREGEPALELAAFAVVKEEASGAERMLDSRKLTFTSTPRAVLRVAGPAGKSHELREGDLLAAGETSYRIAHIRLDPPEVVVARTTAPASGAETRALRVVSAVTPLAIAVETVTAEVAPTAAVAGSDRELLPP